MVVIMAVLITQSPSVFAFEWIDLWLTADQQGQRLMQQGSYREAARKFTTPDKIGAALYLAGEFDQAAAVFGRSGTAEADYNRGNALVLLGLYEEAITSYQAALSKRPAWPEAQQNLSIAQLRELALARPEDDAGGTGGMLEADEIRFDETGKTSQSGSEQVIEAGEQSMGEEAVRAMWLRKVDTNPADFLAARFNYQLFSAQNRSDEQRDE